MDKIEKPERSKNFKNRLNGEHYSHLSFFDKEKKKIFDRSWLFAGSAGQLPLDQQFMVLNFMGESVIVGRYGGQIRAFENRCVHRSAAIHQCDRGRRELKCPFHGWRYDDKGQLRGVPQQKEIFGFTDDQKKSLCLKSYDVEMLGDLIFVRMPSCRTPLSSFLGDFKESLTVFDQMWGTRNPWMTRTVKANWKVLVEAALEAYHTAEVHPNSLGCQDPASIEYYNFMFSRQGHQIMNIGNHPLEKMMTTAATIMFVFPNTFLIQVDGRAASSLSFLPQSSGATLIRSQAYFDRSIKSSEIYQRALRKALQQTNIEDQRICESVQEQIHRQPSTQPLATTEKAVHEFQKHYLGKMSFWN